MEESVYRVAVCDTDILKRDGASYAIPQETGLDSRYDIEGAVLYNNFEPGVPNLRDLYGA